MHGLEGRVNWQQNDLIAPDMKTTIPVSAENAVGETGRGESLCQKSVLARETHYLIIGSCCCTGDIWAGTWACSCPYQEQIGCCCKEMPSLFSHLAWPSSICRGHETHPMEASRFKDDCKWVFAPQLPSLKLASWLGHDDFRQREFVSTEAVFALELFAIDSHTCSVYRANTLVWNNIIHNESSVLWSPAIPRRACAVSHAVICKHSYKHSKPDSYLV